MFFVRMCVCVIFVFGLVANPVYGKRVESEDVAQAFQNAAQAIQEKLPYKDSDLQDIVDTQCFSEQELLNAMDTILNVRYTHLLSDDECAQLKTIKKDLIKSLKRYDISGFSFCVCPNKGFIKDTQYPEFSVVFKNNVGDVKTKTFQGNFVGYGLKIQLAFKFDFIFFIGTNVNFFDSQEPIELGSGFELGIIPPIPYLAVLGNFECTYISFKKHSGGMLILAPSLGVAALSLSYIAGGTLTPVS